MKRIFVCIFLFSSFASQGQTMKLNLKQFDDAPGAKMYLQSDVNKKWKWITGAQLLGDVGVNLDNVLGVGNTTSKQVVLTAGGTVAKRGIGAGSYSKSNTVYRPCELNTGGGTGQVGALVIRNSNTAGTGNLGAITLDIEINSLGRSGKRIFASIYKSGSGSFNSSWVGGTVINYSTIPTNGIGSLRAAYDANGDFVFIINDVNSVWDYPVAWVNQIRFGAGSEWETGWSMDFVTDISTYTNITEIPFSTVWNSNNDGTGSGLDADLLDGKHAADFEPAFAKGTAFNKNFGTVAGTVAAGDDARILNGQTAWGNLRSSVTDWNTAFGGPDFKVGTASANGPISSNVHGIFIPHAGSSGYGTEIVGRNNNLYYRSIENGTILSWLQVADRNWVNTQGFLKTYTETDPTVPSHVKAISTGDMANWNSKQPALNGTGFIKANGTSITYDNTNYIPSLTGGLQPDASKVFGLQRGIEIYLNGTGSTNYPTNVGLAVDFSSGGTGASATERDFTLYHTRATDNFYLRSYDGTGASNGFKRIWHAGNFNPTNYEPAFSKNSAFNKNFGTVSGTIAEGSDSRITNGQTAYSWGDHKNAGYLSYATGGGLGTALQSNFTGDLNNVQNAFGYTTGTNKPLNNNAHFLSIKSNSNQYGGQIGMRNGDISYRGLENNVWTDWFRIWHSGDFTQSDVNKWSNSIDQTAADARYYPLSANPAGYLTSSALTPYLTTTGAAVTYVPLAGTDKIAGELTPLTNSSFDLGRTNFRWNKVYGSVGDFADGLKVSGKDVATQDWVSGQGYLTSFAETDPTVPGHVKSITSTNITTWNNAVAASHSPVTIGTANGLSLSGQQLSLGLASASQTGALRNTDYDRFDKKQDALSSGINIKTINGQSILGGGNLSVSGVTNLSLGPNTGLTQTISNDAGTSVTLLPANGNTGVAGLMTAANQKKLDYYQTNNYGYFTPTGDLGVHTNGGFGAKPAPLIYSYPYYIENDDYALRFGCNTAGGGCVSLSVNLPDPDSNEGRILELYRHYWANIDFNYPVHDIDFDFTTWPYSNMPGSQFTGRYLKIQAVEGKWVIIGGQSD